MGWMYSIGAFLVILVDILMVLLVLYGHQVRIWSIKLNSSIMNNEDGNEVFKGSTQPST